MASIKDYVVGLVLAAGLTAAAAPALAAELTGSEWAYLSDDTNESLQIRGSFGAIGIEAREYVFATPGSTNTASQLIWQSAAPLATIEFDFVSADDWTIAARARGALLGMSYMEDYDWFGPDFVSYDFDDWTHRSQHTNTHLDWYLDASFALGRNLVVEPHSTVNLNAGLKYTDVQWTAIGGDYVYSGFIGDAPGGFRDDTGSFADEPGITYRQQLPALFAGLNAEVTSGEWTFDTGLQAGVVLLGVATDHHWLRDLKFVDHLAPAPMLNLEAGATYNVSDNLGLHMSAAIEKVFMARANTDEYDIPTDDLLNTYSDSAGAEFGSVSVSAGVTGRF